MKNGLAGPIILSVLAAAAHADGPTIHVVSPATTGIPGEEVRVVRHAPDGKLWVAARDPFWRDGGIGIYDFATDTWEVHSKGETPIPSEYINDIEFDAAGVAWIATDAGLVRWDGETWTVYNAANTPMRLAKVGGISIAPNGHIWVNNSDFNAGNDAIYDFDGVGTWTRYRVPDQIPFAAPWTDLSSVLVSADGHVWVANDTLPGLAEFDGTTWTLHGGDQTRFANLIEDHDGNIWMRAGVGGGNAFYRFDRANFTRHAISTTPLDVAVGPDGAVYTGDWAGNVRKTTNAGGSWSFFLSGLNRVHNIEPDPDSTDIWIGTPGAVGHFRGDGAWVRDYNTWNTGFPDYFVDYMTTTSDGMFWVATGEAGLSRFDGERWRNWGNHNAGAEPYPFAGNEPMGGAFRDTQGRFWFGGNGIARWDAEANQFTGFWNWQNNPGMGVTLFPFFAEDMDGRVFAASEYGAIYSFNETSGLWVRENVNPYATLGLPGMASDSAGNVWIAGWFNVHKWDGQSWTQLPLPYGDYLFDLEGVNCVAIAPDDSLWLGTNDGLVHYDHTGFTLYDMSNTPMPASSVRGIDFRDDGVLGLSISDFRTALPYEHGACVVDGPITEAASWMTFQYGSSVLPHYQLGRCAWDPWGSLWVAAISEGCGVISLPPPGPDGDIDGDGDVDLADLARALATFGRCSGETEYDAAADFDADGCVTLADLSVLLGNFGR